MIKFSATLLATLIAASVQAATVDLRILETTDLHSNIMDFDYYKDTPTEKFGLVRTASLIDAARGEVKNSVLVDNGDLIQGSPLGDYMAAKGLKKGEIHPVYKAMNTLDYAVGNLGNHEFNYGLKYLHDALAGAKFPYVNANIIYYHTQYAEVRRIRNSHCSYVDACLIEHLHNTCKSACLVFNENRNLINIHTVPPPNYFFSNLFFIALLS